MFGVALAVPGAFGDDADDPDRVGALLRFAPTAIFGASLLVLAGFLAGTERMAVWVIARRRAVGAAVLLALIPAAVAIPAPAALALVSAVCSLVVAYEVLRFREHRVRVRHPELAA
jgi:membrane protein YdbS with pleckstrin-like domain